MIEDRVLAFGLEVGDTSLLEGEEMDSGTFLEMEKPTAATPRVKSKAHPKPHFVNDFAQK